MRACSLSCSFQMEVLGGSSGGWYGMTTSTAHAWEEEEEYASKLVSIGFTRGYLNSTVFQREHWLPMRCPWRGPRRKIVVVMCARYDFKVRAMVCDDVGCHDPQQDAET